MKSFNIRKFLAGLACMIGLVAFNVSALDTSISPSGASTNNILSSGASISNLSIANAGASAVTVRFIDAPSTNLTLSIGAYTNYSFAAGSVTNTFTTLGGVQQTNIRSGIISVATSNAAQTFTYRTIATATVGASNTLQVPIVGSLVTTYGLTTTNSGACVITVSYSSNR